MQDDQVLENGLSNSEGALLDAEKRRQIIRLVNPYEDKIEYGFRSDSRNSATSSFEITPRNGSINPRDYAIISIEIKDHIKVPEDLRLNLIYWKNDPERRRGYIKGLVPINFVKRKSATSDSNSRGKWTEHLENNRFITLMILFLRPSFLLALIVYNLILLKINIDNM